MSINLRTPGTRAEGVQASGKGDHIKCQKKTTNKKHLHVSLKHVNVKAIRQLKTTVSEGP